MRIHTLLLGLAIAGMITTPMLADENASGGGILNSETVFIGTGDHGGALGDGFNTVTTAAFTGGFTATHIEGSCGIHRRHLPKADAELTSSKDTQQYR